MADISKCEGTNCSLKETCYRYKAESSYWQSWASFWVYAKDGKCDYYWDIKDAETDYFSW